MSESDNAIKIGSEVYTPDGKGTVTLINDRYVFVDLESKLKASYGWRDIFTDDLLTKPGNIVPPSALLPAPEPETESAPEVTA